MDILSEVYYKSAAENERNLSFWENYLQNLKNLDFSIFSDKLKVPTLVPIGSRILFRGELKHTSEVTVALGADYFVKCSLKQAEVLRQHRIKNAQSKVDTLTKEKEYLENQMSFTKKAVYDNQGQEIIEYYSEDDDKVWRQKHRENVRKYKQGNGKKEMKQTEDITDEELWDRLEELELREEIENELLNMNGDNQSLYENKENQKEKKPFVVKEDIKIKNEKFDKEKADKEQGYCEKDSKAKKVTFKEIKNSVISSKFDLLQKVIDKQNELEEKLFELKNKERNQSKNEKDLMSRLDELQQLDELEDEMDRLDDIIENEDVDEDEEEDFSHQKQVPKLQRRVSFVDEDDSETLEITFEHSPIDPKNEPYDPDKGIQKPSDIYEAHSKLFGNSTTSILKKSKYESVIDVPEINAPKEKVVQFDENNSVESQTIMVKDIVEKVNQRDHKLLSQARPTSLFKKKRMQKKS